MAYERQYYTNGDVLDARQMNHMETGIKENSDNISKLSEEKVDKSEISLGKHTDGLVYVFVDGKPVGNGIEMGSVVIETYTITNSLQESTNSNTTTTIVKGSEYTALLVANEGYLITNVTVIMGGEDVTNLVYNDGAIIIKEVTGDINIIVETSEEVVPTDIMSNFNYLGPTTYSPGTYTAWCPTGLIYDETRDVYAHFMTVRGSHYNIPDQIQLWFNTINPLTMEHSEPVYIGDGATNKTSGGGFLGTCIKNGVYYAFSQSYGYYTSEDGGTTWTHNDYETAPTNVWGCYVLSNGRMIMGSDAGAKVNYCSISDDNGANWTKIEANAIDNNYGAFDEPTFVEFGNGTVMAIIRKEVAPSDPMSRPYMRVSNDYGTTWTDAVEMQTVGFMNANNCNAFVHDNYVELFVGCRIPTTNSDYTGSLYTINQYVLDRNKGAVDEFEFVNTVLDYRPDTGLEDFGVSTTNTDDFSTPCIAIKDKSHALMLFFAPARVGVTHHLVAVGNIPVDNYSIPSIIPTSYNANQTFSETEYTEVTVCESYNIVQPPTNGKQYPMLNTGYLKVDDIEDGGFIHLGLVSNGFTDAIGTDWTVLPLVNAVEGKIKSFSRSTGIGRSPMPDGVTSTPTVPANRVKDILSGGEILDLYAFIKNDEWWIYDSGTWIRSASGNCDISKLSYTNEINSFEIMPNNKESLTTYKAVGGLFGFKQVAIIEYDKATT